MKQNNISLEFFAQQRVSSESTLRYLRLLREDYVLLLRLQGSASKRVVANLHRAAVFLETNRCQRTAIKGCLSYGLERAREDGLDNSGPEETPFANALQLLRKLNLLQFFAVLKQVIANVSQRRWEPNTLDPAVGKHFSVEIDPVELLFRS